MNNKKNPIEQRIIFQKMYKEHSCWLLGWLTNKVNCRSRAEDIVQDIFLKLLRSESDLKTIIEPKAYLITMAKRLIVDQIRRKQVEDAYLQQKVIFQNEIQQKISLENDFENRQIIGQALEKLSTLSDKPKHAFLMSRLEGLRHAEISEKLGVSVSMVKKYIVKAHQTCGQI
ncbi:MAG: sigma-70 family RNA polymerase sigma factor [Pseudomonadota bacterium]